MCDFETATKVTKKRSSVLCYKVVYPRQGGKYTSVYADFPIKKGVKAMKFEILSSRISRCSNKARKYIGGYVTAFLKLKDAKVWRCGEGDFLKIIKIELSGDIKVFHNTEYCGYYLQTHHLTVVCGKKVNKILKCYE